MPDSRRHRSRAPKDSELFGPSELPALREATTHLAWLQSHGYADRSSLKLVGDRFSLAQRQRTALMRLACSDADRDAREAKRVTLADAGRELDVDAYNLLTSIECALGGALLLACRDGCLRDMASLHGTWRRVAETAPALELIGSHVERHAHEPVALTWYVDRPVSNSGRLKALIEDVARERDWSWRVELVADPDAVLAVSPRPVVSADRRILDRCRSWINLAREIVAREVPSAWLVELALDPG